MNAPNKPTRHLAVLWRGWFCCVHRWSIRRDISKAIKCCEQAKLGAWAHDEKSGAYIQEAQGYLRAARALLRQNTELGDRRP